MRAKFEPRERWIPGPNAAWRFGVNRLDPQPIPRTAKKNG
jgi:hypothetical protein